MNQKKVLVVDSRLDITRTLEDAIKVINPNVEVKTIEKPTRNLPKDYDLYILHISDVDQGDIQDLRNKQPWSTFMGIGGQAVKINTNASFHEVHAILSGRRLERYFENN